jgi:DNA-binding transcriptional ArsR family regulator
VGPENLAKVLVALADPTRLRLLRFLMHHDHCGAECTDYIGMTQGAVSKHLSVLADAGLVTRRRDGRRIYYRVGQPEVVERMLHDAERLALLNATR